MTAAPPRTQEHLRELESGTAQHFAKAIGPGVPSRCCGVYSIWQGDVLVYIGHAGRAVDLGREGRKTGLADRLSHHGAGRRSGDQFCVYVADRLILPTLSAADLADIGAGTLLLDDFVYVYVQDRFTYRVTVTPDIATAREVEKAARGGGLTAGKPLLNPLPAPNRPPKETRVAKIRERGP